MRYIICCIAALACCGCALTAEERQAIVEQSVALAGEQAEKAAQKLAERLARERGLSEAEAAELAETLRAEARVEAEKAARLIAEKAIPKAEEGKRSKLGGALAAVLMFVLQLAGAGLKPGGIA